MEKCKNCIFFESIPNTFFSEGLGKCLELKTTDMIDIEVQYGYDGGFIKHIEVSENFGCVLHKIKDNGETVCYL